MTDPTEYLLEKIKPHIATFELMPEVVIIHDLQGKAIYMSQRGLKLLNITPGQLLSLTAEQYYERYFNIEDAHDYVPKILGLLQRNNDDEMITYFQQVRFPHNPDWNWYMTSTMIFMRDAEGRPILTISTAVPLDAMHHMTAKAQRLLEENNFLRKHYPAFAKLGKREKAILKLMALGKTSGEISEELFIAKGTVDTHRRNIRKKLGVSSSYDLQKYARAFDLI